MRDVREDSGALTVSELTRRVKTLLEDAFPEVWVRGEVSNFKVQSSGHAYFTLKDSGAQLPAVMFRGDLMRCDGALREGAQIAAFGRITVYEPRGAYQFVIRVALDDGLGRLRREFDALKAKLAAEGLFERARKRPLPRPARSIGFVTSPTGAAIRDFISVLSRRGFRGRLVILPAKVQGVGAAKEIAAQVRRAGELGVFDLLVVGRGGGSLEDLWAFNEEPVARAVAACPVPVISAVGHETDFTLCDFVADVRAETPTAAAELISSAYLELEERLARAEDSIHEAALRSLEDKTRTVDILEARLDSRSPLNRLHNERLRLRTLDTAIHAAAAARLSKARTRLDAVASRLALHTPDSRLKIAAVRLDGLEARLRASDVEATLRRGFVLVKDEAGRTLPRAADIESGKRIHLRFADGEAGATAT